MRPPMRLPLREALYVCSNCRAGVTPRGLSPLTHQFRRHASDSLSFLERARRSLWKGDKPPGPEDPYGGESQIMRRSTPDKERGESGGLAAGEHGISLSEGDEYVQAETWDGLERVGFKPEDAWRKKGTTEADEYTPYGSNIKTKTIPEAARQAAVEVTLMRMLDRRPASICEIVKHHGYVQDMIMACVFDSSAAEQPNTALRFPDQKTLDALVYVFNQIGEGPLDKRIKSPERFLAKEKPDKDDESYRALRFTDPTVQFGFIKRFSQLIGRRIPDQIITSSATVNDVMMKLKVPLKEKPINVAKNLRRRKAHGRLPPNVHCVPVRITRGAKHEDLGRKKFIYAELFYRGLLKPREVKDVDA